jgi:hypothetical protein
MPSFFSSGRYISQNRPRFAGMLCYVLGSAGFPINSASEHLAFLNGASATAYGLQLAGSFPMDRFLNQEASIHSWQLTFVLNGAA